MLLFRLFAVHAGLFVAANHPVAGMLGATGGEEDRHCHEENLEKRGFKVKPRKTPLSWPLHEGDVIGIECADGYIDNDFKKTATKAVCTCQEHHNQTLCYVKPNTDGYKCISKDVCPLPIWQGARTHTVKAVDDDWALLSFKLLKNKNKYLEKLEPDTEFSWDQVIPTNDNWTIVLACPFNVMGVEYDNDPEKSELTEMIEDGLRMMKDCRGDDMDKASMQRNDHRRQRKEKKLARLARKAARQGRNARRNGDYTDKLCNMIKAGTEKKDKDNARHNVVGGGSDATEDIENENKCRCDRQTWRGRKYIGKVSSVDGRVTSSSRDGRMWTIVSKGDGGVNGGKREFKIAIDMLNGVADPLKWMATKDRKANKVTPLNQYTCELGIVPGHFPHLAPCLSKFHQHDIYRHMKDYAYMKKHEHLLPKPTEKPEFTRPPVKPTGRPKPTGKPTDKPTGKPTGKPKPTGDTKPEYRSDEFETPKGFGQRRDPFGAAFLANQPPLFMEDFEE